MKKYSQLFPNAEICVPSTKFSGFSKLQILVLLTTAFALFLREYLFLVTWLYHLGDFFLRYSS